MSIEKYERDLLLEDVIFSTARSGGKGGQHVNKVETKVILKLSILNTSALNDNQKMILLEKLKSNINNEGFLIISAETSRSQLKNKKVAAAKMYKLIDKALKQKKKRKKTKVPKQVKLKRRKDKEIKSETKANRRKIFY